LSMTIDKFEFYPVFDLSKQVGVKCVWTFTEYQ